MYIFTGIYKLKVIKNNRNPCSSFFLSESTYIQTSDSLKGFLNTFTAKAIKLMFYEKSTHVNMRCFNLQQRNKAICYNNTKEA